jgi:hypothetical protein
MDKYRSEQTRAREQKLVEQGRRKFNRAEKGEWE